MYHSVTFDSKNTYTDWHLVPDGRPVIVMPEIKLVTVDVPGSNGILDLSESLTKYPIYSNRSGSMKFHVLNDIEPWQNIHSNIAGYLHGRQRNIILEDDPEYYYHGRTSIAWTSKNDGSGSDIEISYNLEPYKYYYQTSVEEYPELYKGIIVSGSSKIIDLSNEYTIGTVPVVPEFILSNVSSSGVSINMFNAELSINKTVTVNSNGTRKYYDFIISNVNGTNTCKITFNGYGTVNIVFRRMAL